MLFRYTDQLGQLWNSLADYYIRGGLFERARDIYEEAIQTVTTVRDFTQVSDNNLILFMFLNESESNNYRKYLLISPFIL